MESSVRTAAIAAGVALAACLPLMIGDYYVGLIVRIMIYALFALSLQLLVGGAGLISLGQAAGFGIGAYVVALTAPADGPGNFFVLLPCAMAAAAAFAWATGMLALRTKGVYFLMVTLAFAQMVYYVFHDTKLGGGSDGIYLAFRPEWSLGPGMSLSVDAKYSFYLLVLACLLLAWACLASLMRTRFGAALTGIRVNEQRMRAAGYATFHYKLVAYVSAGALAGAAGLLYAVKDGYVTPELLAWEQSGLVLLMVILGGTGPLWGAVIGAVALTLLQELFQSAAVFGRWADHWHLTFGASVIVLVALLPKGLVGLPDQWRHFRTRGAVSTVVQAKH